MKKNIIKSIAIATLLFAQNDAIHAQGFLKKLKEAKNQLSEQVSATNYNPNTGIKINDKWYEEQKEDATKTVLESKFVKDAYGFSGVYYCKDLMMTSTAQGTVKNAVGKVLLTYKMGASDRSLTIESSYHLDAANGLQQYQIFKDGYKFELEHKTGVAMKQMHISGQGNENEVFYIAAKHPFVNDGKVEQAKTVMLKPMRKMTAVVIEPGIVLLTDGGALMYVPKGGRDPEDVIKEKEARATKLTQEDMYQMLLKFSKARQARSDAGEDGYKEMDEEIKAMQAANASAEGEQTNNDSSKNTKATAQQKIRVELQNTSNEQIFLKYEGDISGSSFIGAGSVASFKGAPGARILNKKTGVVYITITAGTKSNTRVKI